MRDYHIHKFDNPWEHRINRTDVNNEHAVHPYLDEVMLKKKITNVIKELGSDKEFMDLLGKGTINWSDNIHDEFSFDITIKKS